MLRLSTMPMGWAGVVIVQDGPMEADGRALCFPYP